MKYDRDETYLHEKLTAGLHPATVDLWPSVAEALPNARPVRHWRRFVICLAAPLLIAAGVLAGTAEFTNLRENPRPSFAPEANTGYAITYERQYFTLDSDFLTGMVANHNGETAADGTKPASGSTSGRLHPSEEDARNVYAKAARGYDSWGEMTAATGLPLVQNAVLDAGEKDDGSAIGLFTDDLPEIPVGTDGRVFMVLPQQYPAGCIPIGRGETPEKLYLRVSKKLGDYKDVYKRQGQGVQRVLHVALAVLAGHAVHTHDHTVQVMAFVGVGGLDPVSYTHLPSACLPSSQR